LDTQTSTKKKKKQTLKEDLKAPSEYYQQQQTQWKKEGGGRTRTRRIISLFGLWFSLLFFVFSSITFPLGVGAFFFLNKMWAGIDHLDIIIILDVNWTWILTHRRRGKKR
jgi:hypothetical protein